MCNPNPISDEPSLRYNHFRKNWEETTFFVEMTYSFHSLRYSDLLKSVIVNIYCLCIILALFFVFPFDLKNAESN